MMNQLKTIILFGLLSVIVIFAGQILGGQTGVTFALILALAMNIGGYFFSDKIALKMSGAQPAGENEYPQLQTMLEQLAKKMNIPTPQLYIIHEEQANAFATGRDPQHASVAVTEGLMRILSDEEIEGVLAHELAHIKNRDILIATIASILASMLSYLGNVSIFSNNDEEERHPLTGILAFLVLPIAATLIQLAISRQREFVADASAAYAIGSGRPLAMALRKIEQSAQMMPMQQSPGLASLYIANPLGGAWGSKLTALFSTHPPTEERIKKLERI